MFPRSQLSSKCNGSELAIITQANTAVETKIVYDGERKRSIQVTQEIFSTFIKVVVSHLFMSLTTSAGCLNISQMNNHRDYFTALLCVHSRHMFALLITQANYLW